MIQQTSLVAYYDIYRKLGLLQRKVLAIIREVGPVSNLMISRYSSIPINIVTPRVNELRKIGLVVFDRKDVCEISGKRVIYWRVRIWKKNSI